MGSVATVLSTVTIWILFSVLLFFGKLGGVFPNSDPMFSSLELNSITDDEVQEGGNAVSASFSLIKFLWVFLFVEFYVLNIGFAIAFLLIKVAGLLALVEIILP